MAEKGSPEDFFRDPQLDATSESSKFRHSGWQNIRKHIWDSMLRTAQSPNRRRSFGECGSYSWLDQNEVDPCKFRIRYNHCHDRLCTPCANARSFKLREALTAVIGTKPVSFITLTLCGKGEPLTELIDRLYRHFRALRQHPLWDDNVLGGAAFLEVKYSDKARRWHPHLHIIADAKFIDQGELSTAWRSITRDSFIVDIRRVKNPEVTAHYVTKYASKPLNSSFSNTPALLDEAMLSLKGRRLCLCFGTWYGTALNDAEDETLEDIDPKEGWKYFMDLETLLERARTGLRDAITVLQLTGVEARWRQSLLNSS